VSAYVALGVGFDEEVEEAWLVVAGNWGVGADDLLGGVVVGGIREGGGEGDVLADGEAEDGGRRGEGEAVDGCVVGEDGLFFKGEGLEGGGVEDFFGFCGICVSAIVLLGVLDTLCSLQSVYIRLANTLYPPSAAATSAAKGSHSLLRIHVPTRRSAEGM